ncbi:hypothetical protein [Dyella japonica]|uniref:Uncharacterized protein n=1 Tax=Dyella japonica A8 TaxID=1217721 RepID=A0A075K2N4_9GAMM|nr:hypothetical protein [Dyella japonica]AIF48195.1 hypothetical protein HY57_13490 [Dyella japonica A8]
MSRPHRTYHEQLDDVREQMRHGRGPTPRATHADAASRERGRVAGPRAPTGQPMAGAADAFARTIHAVEQAAADTRRVHAEGAAQRTQGTHDTFAHGYRHAETAEERREAADRIERNDQRHRDSEDRHRARQDWINFGKFCAVLVVGAGLAAYGIKVWRAPVVA